MNNFKIQQSKIFMHVYRIRSNILSQTLDEKELELYKENTSILGDMERVINLMEKLEDSRYNFSFDLFIRISECWEALSLNHQSKKRFIRDKTQRVDFPELIIAHFCKFRESIIQGIDIEILNDQDVINRVQDDLIKNKYILEQIVMQEIPNSDIQQYLQEITIFGWKSDNFIFELLGFSSYDGKRMFVSLEKHFLSLEEIIQYQVADHFYFWMIKNKNPFLIMAEINNNLFDERKRHLGPGDYYYHQVSQRFIHHPGYFKLHTFNSIYDI